jgi:N5-(carboxyethyl)ornithine synthase
MGQKTIGLVPSTKENEKRIALLPEDIKQLPSGSVYVPMGYGKDHGFSDKDYKDAGAKVTDLNTVLKQDILVDPKFGDSERIMGLKNKTLVGWMHAGQNPDLTASLVKKNNTVYAFEEMFYPDKKTQQGKPEHVFAYNNWLAGYSAAQHGFQTFGDIPAGKKVAVLGRGNSAQGAIAFLTQNGVAKQDISVYGRDREQDFLKEVKTRPVDVLVNAVLWDSSRKDYILDNDAVNELGKKGLKLILDVSCDHDGAIQSSHPTSIEHPMYELKGVQHYAVDHTPGILYRTASRHISEKVAPHLMALIMGKAKEDPVLEGAKIIAEGKVLDPALVKRYPELSGGLKPQNMPTSQSQSREHAAMQPAKSDSGNKVINFEPSKAQKHNQAHRAEQTPARIVFKVSHAKGNQVQQRRMEASLDKEGKNKEAI